MENKQPHCLEGPDPDQLALLGRGDACLSTIIVGFSRSRGRYERQGIFAEQAAILRAEEECLKERAETGRVAGDKQMADEIAGHASVRGSGRVGRTAAAKAFDEGALTAAVIAAIRHRHTDCDTLPMQGLDRMDARQRTGDKVETVLECWRSDG